MIHFYRFSRNVYHFKEKKFASDFVNGTESSDPGSNPLLESNYFYPLKLIPWTLVYLNITALFRSEFICNKNLFFLIIGISKIKSLCRLKLSLKKYYILEIK